MEKDKLLQAGKIASQVREYIKPQIKKGTPLLEIAEKIESKIIELGAIPSFPTNLSINNIAAHYTPDIEDKTLASGLLKVDFGASVDGHLSDTAFSIDLEDSEENKKLIEAAEAALTNAIKISKAGILTNEIGREIQATIESKGFSPIVNLSGHSMEEYDLHSGVTIPNVDDSRELKIEEGLFAIEPFATNGLGKVHDGKPSGIYQLIDTKNIRSPIAREVLDHIAENYSTLPFCSRWIIQKFGPIATFALKQLEENENLHQYPQLLEAPGTKVAQAEHTILIEEKETTVTTA